MSTISLSRLCNGGESSSNKNFDHKFNTLPTKKHVPKLSTPVDIDINNNAPQPAVRRKLLNRRGSLHHNQFKGVRKELIEKHASMIVHTMTVCGDFFENKFLNFVLMALNLADKIKLRKKKL